MVGLLNMMISDRLTDFTDDELAILFYVINVHKKVTDREYDQLSIKWIRPQILFQKLEQSEKDIKDEFKPVFDGLMSKLGYIVSREKKEETKKD